MKNVKDMLQTKGSEVWAIAPGASVFEALRLMAEKGIGALVVTEGEEFLGIVSERDYARKVALHGVTSRGTPVRDIMTREVLSVRPGMSAEGCLALMTEKHCRHLPVLEENRLVGLISIGDAVKAVIAGKENLIHELEKYIAGRP